MKTDIKKILASKTKKALSSNILSSDAIRQNIVIIKDLKSFIPPLSKEELAQLEENIKQHGCQTPIQLWQTTKYIAGVSDNIADNTEDDSIYVLIDGHNRLEICKKNNLPFDIYILSFTSIKEAKDYMINLQLGRRNLSPTQISYFRGLRYNNEKTDKINNLSQNYPKGQNDPSGNSTAERLSKEYNVSPKTIKRDAEFAKGMEMIAPDLRNEILNGVQKIEKKIIQKIAKTQHLSEPIKNFDELITITDISKEEDDMESVGNTTQLKELSDKILTASKKYATTHAQQDLEQILILVNKSLELYKN
jgi:hypothetical protein